MTEISDAAWAHNRWPTIGLYAGAGIGLLVGIVFVLGWRWTVAYIAVLAVTGCLVGFGLAQVIYPWPKPPVLSGRELEPATEDDEKDRAEENVAGGDDDAGGVPRSEDEAKGHGQDA